MKSNVSTKKQYARGLLNIDTGTNLNPFDVHIPNYQYASALEDR